MKPLPALACIISLVLVVAAGCAPAPTFEPVAVLPTEPAPVVPTSTTAPTAPPLPTATPVPQPTATAAAPPTATPTLVPTPEVPRIRIGYYGSLREGPGESYAVVAAASPSSTYDVCSRWYTWLRICGHDGPQWWLEGKAGSEWLSGSMDQLAEGRPPIPTPTPASFVPRVEILAAINIRSGPGTDYPVVATGSPGDEYAVSGRDETGDWVQLRGHVEPEWWVYAGGGLGLVAFAVGSATDVSAVSAPAMPTPTPIHPVGEVVFHAADEHIAYSWFSYVPRGLSKEDMSFVRLTTAAPKQSDDYRNITEAAREFAVAWASDSRVQSLILLVPAIPRRATPPYVYSTAFDWRVFLESTDALSRRPDLQVNSMLDRLIGDLRRDGYNVHERVFVEGFSAGGMFAQRFALLHPERVQAVAAGHCGGSITFAEPLYDGAPMDWPVGVHDFEELAGYSFDRDEYLQLPQLLYIGDRDTANSAVSGVGELWRTQSQIDFVNQTFGDTDPIRLRRQVQYLQGLGYDNIEFRSYPGVGHSYTSEMIADVMEFFSRHRSPLP